MGLYHITFSPTGGTQRVLEAVAAAWEGEAQTIDLTRPDLSPVTLTPDDLCLVAVPSYGGRVPSIAAQRLALLTGNGAAAVLLVVYGNRAQEDTLLELSDALTAQGFRPVAGVAAVAEHSIVRKFAAGRPDEADRAQLLDFGRRIAAALAADPQRPAPALPGNRPYRAFGALPIKPKTGLFCVRCKRCAQRCPVGAIPLDKPNTTDDAACISCMRCVVICPPHTRKINRVMLLAAENKLKPVCTTRRENELYL